MRRDLSLPAEGRVANQKGWMGGSVLLPLAGCGRRPRASESMGARRRLDVLGDIPNGG